MRDDPDVQAVLSELENEEDNSSERAKEETAFKKDISALRETIQKEKGLSQIIQIISYLGQPLKLLPVLCPVSASWDKKGHDQRQIKVRLFFGSCPKRVLDTVLNKACRV